MNEKYTAKVSIEIEAPPGKVWDALTDPQLIKKYFFGTEAVSEWKVGSTLEFKGVWEGKEYLDKGTILELIPRKLLRYTYLSSFSGLPDVPNHPAQHRIKKPKKRPALRANWFPYCGAMGCSSSIATGAINSGIHTSRPISPA